jgi:hypothetical protein
MTMTAGLALAGRVLVGEVGSPVRLLRVLGDLGDRWADPVAPMISLLALLAETLVAYILVVLALRSLCLLPGSAGRAAGRVTLLVTPVVVRRLLDLPVGGTLVAQATLVATSGLPPGRLGAVPTLAMATSSSSGGHAVPVPEHDLGPPGTTGLGPLGIKQGPPGMGLGPPGTGSTRPGQAVTGPVETRPLPAGHRRHCRPGWGADRPTRPEVHMTPV